MRKIVAIILFSTSFTYLSAQNQVDDFFAIENLATTNIEAALKLAQEVQNSKNTDKYIDIQYANLLFDNEKFSELLNFCEAKTDNPELLKLAALASAKLEDYELWTLYFEKYLNFPEFLEFPQIKEDFEFVYLNSPNEWKNFWGNYKNPKEKEILIQAFEMIETDKCFDAYLLLQDLKSDEYELQRVKLSVQALICMKDFKTARRSLSKSINEYPEDIELSIVLANLLAEQNKTKQAYPLYEKCMEINPYDKNLWLKLAVEANNSNNFERAEHLFSQYLKHTQNADVEIVYQYSQVLLNSEKYDLAISQLDVLINNDASAWNFWMARGDAHYKLKNYEEAFHNYQMALDIKPDIAEAWYNSAWCVFNTNQTERACFMWEKALHYKHPEAKASLSRYCK